jgi:hypothetical protein
VEELANIAFSNMGDYLKIGEDGVPRVDLTNITRGQAAAIKKIVVTTGTVEHGGRRRPVRRVRLELRNKLPALVRLVELKGMFDRPKPVEDS